MDVEFMKIVNALHKHPNMYTLEGTFDEVCAYISGYAAGSVNSPISGEGSEIFGRFVCAFFQYPDKYWWPFVIKDCSQNDTEALQHLHDLLVTFSEKSQIFSGNELLMALTSELSPACEGEPEKTWRTLSSALLRGQQEEIEPLIQEHIDAHVLWDQGEYPDGVAQQLEEISSAYPVKRISGNEDEGEVMMVTSDFGKISAKLVAGRWRIDVQKIIEARKMTGS